MSTRIILALGGNLGDVPQTFAQAIQKLQRNGLTNITPSSCYTTAPIDCDENAPDFVNAALSGDWNDTPEKLLTLCKQLESEAGRPSQYKRNADRPLDIDIIFFGEEIVTSENLVIPHKEAHNRLFVMVPVAEIAPDFIHPLKKKTASELLVPLKTDSEYAEIISNKSPLPKSCI